MIILLQDGFDPGNKKYNSPPHPLNPIFDGDYHQCVPIGVLFVFGGSKEGGIIEYFFHFKP